MVIFLKWTGQYQSFFFLMELLVKLLAVFLLTPFNFLHAPIKLKEIIKKIFIKPYSHFFIFSFTLHNILCDWHSICFLIDVPYASELVFYIIVNCYSIIFQIDFPEVKKINYLPLYTCGKTFRNIFFILSFYNFLNSHSIAFWKLRKEN